MNESLNNTKGRFQARPYALWIGCLEIYVASEKRVAYDVFAALDNVPLFHEEVEHPRRAGRAPEQKKPRAEAFGTFGQNNPCMLTHGSDPGVGRRCGD